jgi:hypothetical protein
MAQLDQAAMFARSTMLNNADNFPQMLAGLLCFKRL